MADGLYYDLMAEKKSGRAIVQYRATVQDWKPLTLDAAKVD